MPHLVDVRGLYGYAVEMRRGSDHARHLRRQGQWERASSR